MSVDDEEHADALALLPFVGFMEKDNVADIVADFVKETAQFVPYESSRLRVIDTWWRDQHEGQVGWHGERTLETIEAPRVAQSTLRFQPALTEQPPEQPLLLHSPLHSAPLPSKICRALLSCLLHLPRDVRHASPNIAVIGTGGGTMALWISSLWPSSRVDAVDNDAEVLEVAAAWFGLSSSGAVHLHLSDGVDFLASHPGHFDAVIVDVGGFGDPHAHDLPALPSRFLDPQFLSSVLPNSLRPGGLSIINCFSTPAAAAAVAEVLCNSPDEPNVGALNLGDAPNSVVFARRGDVLSGEQWQDEAHAEGLGSLLQDLFLAPHQFSSYVMETGPSAIDPSPSTNTPSGV